MDNNASVNKWNKATLERTIYIVIITRSNCLKAEKKAMNNSV
jgi:hypothetical protein